jgi:molecular chaperone GrpE
MTSKSKQTKPAPPVEDEAVVACEPESQATEPSQAKEKAAPMSEQELDQLKSRAAQADDHWDKFLRSVAEFDNYRKRVARERDELVRNTRENVLSALLPALDNLERALGHSAEGTPLHDGLLQVEKQFERVLADFGLVEIKASPGDLFDPAFHEAVSHIESAEYPDGVVLDQLQSGYKIADRLLRPARVVVSKGPPPGAPAEDKNPEP